MAKRITPGQIRRTNRQQVFQYIYDEKKVSQQDIAYALQLSRPTVAAALTEMEEMGMILKSGYLDSDQIGRKAAAYSIDETFRVAVGVEIMRSRVKFVAADLYGRMLGREIWDFPYANEQAYFSQVSEKILAFIHKLSLPDEKILGIGIAIQGLVNADGSEVVYGTILDCTGLKIEVFTRHLPFPCAFVHDPDAAAISEIWCSPELKNAYYLSMSRHLGGSIIYNRRIAIGRDGRSTLFEHIVVRPEGKPCYCGKRGCLETICSMSALLGDEDPDVFFAALRTGGSAEKTRWTAYLMDVALMAESLHLLYDMDIILGGHLAAYLREDDLDFLRQVIRERCPFPVTGDFLLLSKMPSHNITMGAALYFLQKYLREVGT